MPRPEGYRKAQRLMKLAEDFDIPVISFVDTPGAYPGVGAEQRGQSEAIATAPPDPPSPIIIAIIGTPILSLKSPSNNLTIRFMSSKA